MMKYTKGNTCPNCGKEFKAEGELVPNTKDKDLYGGRVNFFKEVKCKCGNEYVLLIEKSFDVTDGLGMKVIDMLDVTKGNDLETFKNRIIRRKEQEAEQIKLEERTVATIVSKEAQIQRLEVCTINELKTLCRLHKVQTRRGDTKYKMIQRLLQAVPNLVVASPRG